MAEHYIPIAVQRSVIAHAKGYCEYCYFPAAFSSSTFNFDHIIALSKGGTAEFENIAHTCGGCNGFKREKIEHIDPLTGQITRLFHPRKDIWSDHFEWSADDFYIEGKTAIGRATIDLLQMNRVASINIRKLLKPAGLHPPVL
jgi:hypothetical protein